MWSQQSFQFFELGTLKIREVEYIEYIPHTQFMYLRAEIGIWFLSQVDNHSGVCIFNDRVCVGSDMASQRVETDPWEQKVILGITGFVAF